MTIIKKNRYFLSTYAGADQGEHDALVECKRFALLHLDALLVQAFHGVHFSRVGFTAAVNLAETAAPDNAMNAEVVHCQLCACDVSNSRSRAAAEAEPAARAAATAPTKKDTRINQSGTSQ